MQPTATLPCSDVLIFLHPFRDNTNTFSSSAAPSCAPPIHTQCCLDHLCLCLILQPPATQATHLILHPFPHNAHTLHVAASQHPAVPPLGPKQPAATLPISLVVNTCSTSLATQCPHLEQLCSTQLCPHWAISSQHQRLPSRRHECEAVHRPVCQQALVGQGHDA